MKNRKRKVFCEGCAHLLYLTGGGSELPPPACVATAEFIPGPLRKRIGVKGRVRAEKRNRNNDCPYRESVSLKAYQLKRWIVWRHQNGGKEPRETNIKKYPISWEKAYSQDPTEGGYVEIDDYEGEEESLVDQIKEAPGEESILLDGGTDGVDERGSTDQGGGGDVPDAGNGHRRKRKSVPKDGAGTGGE